MMRLWVLLLAMMTSVFGLTATRSSVVTRPPIVQQQVRRRKAWHANSPKKKPRLFELAIDACEQERLVSEATVSLMIGAVIDTYKAERKYCARLASATANAVWSAYSRDLLQTETLLRR